MEPDLIPVEPLQAIFGVLAAVASMAVPAIIKAVSKPAIKKAATVIGGAATSKVAKGLGAVAIAGGTGYAIDTALTPVVPAQMPPFSGPPGPGGRGVMPLTGPVMGGPGITALSPAADKFGRPFLTTAGYESRIRCPSGYVAVTLPDGSRACALKGPARAAGLWKARPKPMLSAADGRTLRKADRLQKKVKRIAKVAGVNITRTIKVTAAGNPVRRRKR